MIAIRDVRCYNRPMKMRVFDVHIHVQPWDMMKPGALDRLKISRADGKQLAAIMEGPDALLRHLDDQGVEKVCNINYIAPEVMGFTEAVNDYALRFANAAPGRIIPFGSIHPVLTPDPEGDLRRIIDRGIRGIKIHPPHQLFAANDYRNGLKALATIYRVCQETRTPVMIHGGTSVFPGARNTYGDPMPIDDVAVDFPELRIILAHGGRPLWMATAFFLARRHRNLFIDISGIPPKRLLEYFPRLPAIASKVLFGTDWPDLEVKSIRANVDDFVALPLPNDVKQNILFNNAERLFAKE